NVGIRARRQQSATALLRGDVADDGCHLGCAELAEVLGRSLQRILPARADCQLDALSHQRLCAPSAQSLGCSADDRRLASDAEIHGLASSDQKVKTGE